MPEPTLSLHRKLAQVMYEAGRIPKNGNFKQPGEYGHFKFVQAGDAADMIRKALADLKVTMIPSAIELLSEAEHETAKGTTMTTITVRTTWTLTDADTGETATIQSMGSGADAGDKASPKAQTNAMKYALLMGFLLSTGDDPELSDSSDRQRRPAAGAGATQTPTGYSSRPVTPPGVVAAEGGLIGIASLGRSGPVDGQLRQTPDGASVGFVIGEGREKVQVVAYGPKAEAFAVVLPVDVLGKRVQVFGPISTEKMKVGGRDVTFPRVRLERLITPDARYDFTDEPALPEPPPDIALVGEQEAETAPLFDDVA